MNKGTNYINKISELYQVENSIKAIMIEKVDRIEKELENWSWEDIEYAIDLFYTKKNDKNYPKIAQIKAILNTNRKDNAINLTVGTRNDDGLYNEPTTSIKVITILLSR